MSAVRVRRHHLATLVGLALLVAAVLLPAVVASLACFWLGGSALVLALALRAGDRTLIGIVAASTVARSALAVALYLISERAWPVLRRVQMGDGFWLWAPDSAYYHQYAHGAAFALEAGLGLPQFAGAPDYPLLLALMYRVFDSQPLYAIFVNVWAVSAGVVLASLLAHDLLGARAGRVTAVAVAFWPSLVLWSAQLLRDSLLIPLILAFLLGVHRFSRSRGKERAGWMLALAVALFAIYRLRFYVAAALLLAIAVVFGATAVAALARRRRADALAQLALIALLTLSAWGGASVTYAWLPWPADRQLNHKLIAAKMLSTGDEDGALWQLQARAAERWSGPPMMDALVAKRVLEIIARRDLARLQDEIKSGRVVASATPSPPAPVDTMSGISYWRAMLLIARFNDGRQAFVRYGAASNIDEDVQFTGAGSVLRYLPRAVANSAFTPNPLTRFAGPGVTGGLRNVAMLEVLLFAALLVLVVRSFGHARRAGPEVVALLVAYAGLLAIVTGLLVPTVGILFRLRLGFVVPLCVLVGEPSLWWRRRGGTT